MWTSYFFSTINKDNCTRVLNVKLFPYLMPFMNLYEVKETPSSSVLHRRRTHRRTIRRIMIAGQIPCESSVESVLKTNTCKPSSIPKYCALMSGKGCHHSAEKIAMNGPDVVSNRNSFSSSATALIQGK